MKQLIPSLVILLMASVNHGSAGHLGSNFLSNFQTHQDEQLTGENQHTEDQNFINDKIYDYTPGHLEYVTKPAPRHWVSRRPTTRPPRRRPRPTPPRRRPVPLPPLWQRVILPPSIGFG